jgi:hypothetical protein
VRLSKRLSVLLISVAECLKRYLVAQGVVLPAAGLRPYKKTLHVCAALQGLLASVPEGWHYESSRCWSRVNAGRFNQGGLSEHCRPSQLTPLTLLLLAVASLLSTLLAPVYNYIFIFSCGFGLAGAAFANGEHSLVQTCTMPGAWTPLRVFQCPCCCTLLWYMRSHVWQCLLGNSMYSVGHAVFMYVLHSVLQTRSFSRPRCCWAAGSSGTTTRWRAAPRTPGRAGARLKFPL